MKNFWIRFFRSLGNWIDRPWAHWFLAVLAGADLFLVVIPTDMLVVVTSLVRPRHWWKHCLFLTTGSAAGALVLAFVVQRYGNLSFLETASWINVESWIHSRGALALGAIALSPFPQQPAVALAGLSGIAPLKVGLAIWLGRLIKYVFFSWVALKMPELLNHAGGRFLGISWALEAVQKEEKKE